MLAGLKGRETALTWAPVHFASTVDFIAQFLLRFHDHQAENTRSIVFQLGLSVKSWRQDFIVDLRDVLWTRYARIDGRIDRAARLMYDANVSDVVYLDSGIDPGREADRSPSNQPHVHHSFTPVRRCSRTNTTPCVIRVHRFRMSQTQNTTLVAQLDRHLSPTMSQTADIRMYILTVVHLNSILRKGVHQRWSQGCEQS